MVRYRADAYLAEHIQASTSAGYRPRVKVGYRFRRFHRVEIEHIG